MPLSVGNTNDTNVAYTRQPPEGGCRRAGSWAGRLGRECLAWMQSGYYYFSGQNAGNQAIAISSRNVRVPGEEDAALLPEDDGPGGSIRTLGYAENLVRMRSCQKSQFHLSGQDQKQNPQQTTLLSDRSHAGSVHKEVLAGVSKEDDSDNNLKTSIQETWETGRFSFFTGIKNAEIHYAAFVSSGQNNGLVILPGRAESYFKYQELVHDLSQLKPNLNIFILDHRGQGLSSRTPENKHKGYIEQFDDYVGDLDLFIERVVGPRCQNKAPCLLAHSMGGGIAIRFMQKYPGKVQSALLSSPMIAVNFGRTPLWLVKSCIYSVAAFNKWLSNEPWYFFGQGDYKAKPFEQNNLTHSAQRYQDCIDLYQKRPQLQLGGATFGWLAQVLQTTEKLFANIDKISEPITLLQADKDSIVDNEAQGKFYSELLKLNQNLCPDGKVHKITGAKHELLFEQDVFRKQALGYVFDWLAQDYPKIPGCA